MFVVGVGDWVRVRLAACVIGYLSIYLIIIIIIIIIIGYNTRWSVLSVRYAYFLWGCAVGPACMGTVRVPSPL